MMKTIRNLTAVIFYLLTWLAVYCLLGYELYKDHSGDASLFFACVYTGGAGGVLYCLRAVYLNYCVAGIWSPRWIPWYIIRPVVSMMTGAAAYLMLKGGLMVFEAKKSPDATNLGFYMLAFLAGYNVDRFLSKVEDLARARWAIEKSRVGKGKETPGEKKE